MGEGKPIVLFDLVDSELGIQLNARSRDSIGIEIGVGQALEFPLTEATLRLIIEDMKLAVYRGIEKSNRG